MKVSIITACYNRAGSIRDAMESVLVQTYHDIEYIVVDGCSTDGSIEIIRNEVQKLESDQFRSEHPDFSFKWISEPDRGMYEAINKGIRIATGDVVALCHSDDRLYNEHTVETVVEEFNKFPHTEMVYADGMFVKENGKAVRIWKGKNMARWRLCCGWLPLHTTCYIRKDVFGKYGLYDDSYRIAADTKLLLNLLYKKRISTAYMPQYVVRMLMGGASTDINRQWEMWKEDLRAFKETGFLFPIWMKLMKMMWKPSQFIKGKLVMKDNYGKKE